MEPEIEKVVPPVDDEAELDKILQADISKVRAGEVLTPESTKPEVRVEEKVETPAPETKPKVEDTSKPPVAENKEEEFEFRIPNKGKFESDESYELRITLFDNVKRRRAATTPEAKAAISAEIKEIKGQLRNLNGSDKTINNLNNPVEDKIEEDPNLAADRAVFKKLGGITKEDLVEIARTERLEQEAQSALKTFIERSPELKDQDVRDTFFDFVDANYVWQGKGGKELLTVLELARESMFKPSETIQERVLKGANVAEKVNAMQFPGSTGNKVELSAEMRKDIDELKATGMSEEKARQLLED